MDIHQRNAIVLAVGAAFAATALAVAPGQIDLSDIAAGHGGFVIMGECAYDYSGYSVAGAGDVNGDGLADLIIGAFGRSGGPRRPRSGRSYVVFGQTGNGAFMWCLAKPPPPQSSCSALPTARAALSSVNPPSGKGRAEWLPVPAMSMAMVWPIVGGAGSDVLRGNGGADVLYGGAGDDNLVVTASGIRALNAASPAARRCW